MMRYSPLVFLLMSLSACAPGMSSGDMVVHKVEFPSLEKWDQEDHQALLKMMRSECRRLLQLPPDTGLGGATSLPSGRKVGDWIKACQALPAADKMTSENARQYFEEWFQPYSIQKNAFYTGYYEPQIEGSLRRGGEYQYPLYRRPADLLRARTEMGRITFGHWVNSVFQPYDTRASINAGALSGRGLELAWLKSPVDVLSLQLQGVGRLLLPNGKTLRVAYDGRNGQPYNPIGSALVQRGALRSQEVTVDSVRDWLLAHPEEMQSVIEQNPNYVFFRTVNLPLSDGPGGALGISLTPQRSLAIDRSLVPYAVPVWVKTSIQDRQGQVTPWEHMTFAQDVGTNIRGAGRGDIFTGWGEEAESMVSDLKSSGRMTLLLPRAEAKAESKVKMLSSTPK